MSIYAKNSKTFVVEQHKKCVLCCALQKIEKCVLQFVGLISLTQVAERLGVAEAAAGNEEVAESYRQYVWLGSYLEKLKCVISTFGSLCITVSVL